MSERRINVANPIVYADGTMEPAFRDFIFRVDVALTDAGLSATWGQIQGTLANQTDLQSQLDVLASSISTNVTDISANTAAIGINTGNIATITANIATFLSGDPSGGTKLPWRPIGTW